MSLRKTIAFDDELTAIESRREQRRCVAVETLRGPDQKGPAVGCGKQAALEKRPPGCKRRRQVESSKKPGRRRVNRQSCDARSIRLERAEMRQPVLSLGTGRSQEDETAKAHWIDSEKSRGERSIVIRVDCLARHGLTL
jgi:hypothetical protein